jgi:endoglucanase
VFGLDGYDLKVHGRALSFAESVRQGYELASVFGKPIWVAELGYEGSPDYVASWRDDVTRRYSEYPQLEAVVYFNDREVWDWPYNLGRPDWRVVSEGAPYPTRR